MDKSGLIGRGGFIILNLPLLPGLDVWSLDYRTVLYSILTTCWLPQSHGSRYSYSYEYLIRPYGTELLICYAILYCT